MAYFDEYAALKETEWQQKRLEETPHYLYEELENQQSTPLFSWFDRWRHWRDHIH